MNRYHLTLKIFVFTLVVSCASMAQATTYYVNSVNGNDANNGTSPSTAWATIHKVNTWQGSHEGFNPGDNILFACGDTFREQLTANYSGAAGSPIVFDSYNPQTGLQGPCSSGTAATISGAYEIPANSWSVYSGNIYVTNVGTLPISQPSEIHVDGTFYPPASTYSQNGWFSATAGSSNSNTDLPLLVEPPVM